MAGFERDSEAVLRWRRGHAADSRRLGVARLLFEREVDLDALVPVLPLDADDRRVLRRALPDVIEQLDTDELRAPFFADLVLHATQELGGELLTGAGLQRNRHGVHALAEMNRARARRLLVSRGQQDQLVFDRGRRRAGGPRCARAALPHSLGRGRGRALPRGAVRWTAGFGAGLQPRAAASRACLALAAWCQAALRARRRGRSGSAGVLAHPGS